MFPGKSTFQHFLFVEVESRSKPPSSSYRRRSETNVSRRACRLSDEVSKLQEKTSAMLEVSRLEEASLRRLHETAAAEGRRLALSLIHI